MTYQVSLNFIAEYENSTTETGERIYVHVSIFTIYTVGSNAQRISNCNTTFGNTEGHVLVEKDEAITWKEPSRLLRFCLFVTSLLYQEIKLP